MEIIEAIHNRYSMPEVDPRPVPRELIETLLSAAVQAPNHYRVHPWRFVVLTGDARSRLGQVMADSLLQKFPQLGPEALEKERKKPLRAPVLIVAGVDKTTDPRAIEIENICAVAAACQNLLLAAQKQGLGVQWRTGDPARDPLVKHFLGFEPDQLILAFLYIGFPQHEPPVYQRPGFEERTVWME